MKEAGVVCHDLKIPAIGIDRPDAIEQCLRLGKVTGHLIGRRQHSNYRGVLRAQVTSVLENFSGGNNIAHSRVRKASVAEQKNVLWIQFNRLPVILLAVFPFSLPPRQSTEEFGRYRIVRKPLSNGLVVMFRGFIIAFYIRGVEPLRQDGLRQRWRQLYRVFHGLACCVPPLRRTVPVNISQAVCPDQLGPGQTELRVQPDRLFKRFD